MIIDQLKNAPLYHGISPRVATALRYLQQTDLARLAPSRHDLEGDDLFAMVSDYATKTRDKGFWEAHRKYIDVQYVVSGRERIGFAPIGALTAGDYDAGRDFLPLSGDGGDALLVTAGTFMILFPEDAHMPGLAVAQPEPVRKIVLKVRV